MTRSSGPVPSCQNGACEQLDIPVSASAASRCGSCGHHLALPVCPSWCLHPTTRLEASCFVHVREIATTELSEEVGDRIRGTTVSVDICLEGDGDDPSAVAVLQVYLPNDAWIQVRDPETLRTIAATLTDAADAADSLLASASAV